MEYIPDFVLDVYNNTLLAGLLYWLPLGFCAAGYIARTARNFATDRRQRTTPGVYYRPTDTLGSLIGRAVVSLLPIGNLLAAIFDLGPEVFGRFFEFIGRVFNQPLVPDLPDGQEIRNRRAVEGAVERVARDARGG